jgi:hypothetical protein
MPTDERIVATASGRLRSAMFKVLENNSEREIYTISLFT